VVVERAGQQAGGGGLADPAHPGEHEGVSDTARGEGVGERAHHRFLADQVLEPPRPVLARQDLIVVTSRRGRLQRRRGLVLRSLRRSRKHREGLVVALFRRGVEIAGVPGGSIFGRTVGGHEPYGSKRWRLDGDPQRNSLRLLPSGPDRGGEDYARRQPPPPISGAGAGEARRSGPTGRKVAMIVMHGVASLPLALEADAWPPRPSSPMPSPAIRWTAPPTAGATPRGCRARLRRRAPGPWCSGRASRC